MKPEQTESCESREPGKRHCDHEVANRTMNGVVTERTHRCCFCAREWTEFPEPPKPYATSGSYVVPKHGPYAPTTLTTYSNGGQFTIVSQGGLP